MEVGSRPKKRSRNEAVAKDDGSEEETVSVHVTGNGGVAESPHQSKGSESEWLNSAAFEECIKKCPKQIPFGGAPRLGTLSVALPASIAANAQSDEMRAALAGQLARTLVVMAVDEVVIYEDCAEAICKDTGRSRALDFLVRNLQYLETPQYLRKRLFSLHADLKFSGLQHPLDAPHHLRRTEWLPYREGAVLQETTEGCLVDVGLAIPVRCPQKLPVGHRVTLRLNPEMKDALEVPGSSAGSKQQRRSFRGEAVSSQEPPRRAGIYWGYKVRAAPSLRAALQGHSLGEETDDGEKRTTHYDCLVGTSERGTPLREVASDLQDGSYKHMLVVFGGLRGLEAVLADPQCGVSLSEVKKAVRASVEGIAPKDSKAQRKANRAIQRLASKGGPLAEAASDDGKMRQVPPSILFDVYINTCLWQASRTIRAEEALLITLTAFRSMGIHSRETASQGQGAETARPKRKPHLPAILQVMDALRGL